MPGDIAGFNKALARAGEIDLSVKGRKTGRTTSRPVWFVLEPADSGVNLGGAPAGENASTLYLLPYRGTDTEWYKNALAHPTVTLKAGGATAEAQLVPITDAAQVAAVVEKFRAKYGAGNVKTYYQKLDVAAIAQL